jgi:3-oxoacyl-[acyl-carrier protein] reductase
VRLEGKVAIITGGGARVAIVEFDRETGQAALDSVRAAGGEAMFLPADVSDEVEMQAMAAKGAV